MPSKPTPPPIPIDGKTFVYATTINSMYANHKIELRDKAGTYYRIDCDEILPLIQKHKWHLVKKTKYQHLIRAI